MEESPDYESKSNGEVERVVQSVQGQFRTMKDGLESRLGKRIGGEHPCIPWLVAHASDTITRMHVNRDGTTGYHQVKGRKFNGASVEFGENILYLHTYMDAGDGGNSGRFRRYREVALEYAFMFDLVGITR